MPHNQDPDRLADDAEQKMKRETFQVSAPNVAFSDGKALRVFGRSSHTLPQFGIEFISELPRGRPLVSFHDLVDIRVNPRMKDKLHHCRR